MSSSHGRGGASNSESARLTQIQKAQIVAWVNLIQKVPASRIQDRFIIGMETDLHSLLQEGNTNLNSQVVAYIRQAKNYLSSAVWLIENNTKRPPEIYEYVDLAVEALKWALQYYDDTG